MPSPRKYRISKRFNNIAKLPLQLILFPCILAGACHSQTKQSVALNIGDKAPELRVNEWLKGSPVKQFKRGNVYVIEFWATWCGPCKTAMPHLSYLARKYKKDVIIASINVYENKNTTLARVKAFIDSMGNHMDYSVAIEDKNYTVADWFLATGEHGIPTAFVVDKIGKLAWIGLPRDLEEVLQKILSNTWDIDEALVKRNFNKYIEEMDDSALEEFRNYGYEDDKNSDSAFSLINKIINREPELKYAPHVAYYTLLWLLRTSPQKALTFAKEMLVTSTHYDPQFNSVIALIELQTEKSALPVEMYKLCAEAHQMKLDYSLHNISIPNTYRKMADWYLRAGNRTKAIESQQKAVDALSDVKNFSKAEMIELKYCLEHYKRL